MIDWAFRGSRQNCKTTLNFYDHWSSFFLTLVLEPYHEVHKFILRAINIALKFGGLFTCWCRCGGLILRFTDSECGKGRGAEREHHDKDGEEHREAAALREPLQRLLHCSRIFTLNGLCSHSNSFTFLLVRHSHFELKRDRSWWSFKAQWTTKIKLAAIWWKFFFVRHARCAAALSTDGHFRWDKILVCSFAALTRHGFYEMKSSKIDLELITFQSLGSAFVWGHSRKAPVFAQSNKMPCPRARWLSRGMIDSVINAC